MKRTLPLLVALLAPVAAQASAVAQLKAFVASTRTLTADFNQVVSGQNRQDKASGTLEISRPGKFRWNYTSPNQQLIVGDGRTLWVYDKDLAQVTKKSLDAALGNSPAAVLAGSNAIEKNYTLKEMGASGGLEWLAASPRHQDNTFSAIRMGFRNNQLMAMELTDNFGNQTQIHFANLKKNPAVPASHFQFVPPKGADVMSGD